MMQKKGNEVMNEENREYEVCLRERTAKNTPKAYRAAKIFFVIFMILAFLAMYLFISGGRSGIVNLFSEILVFLGVAISAIIAFVVSIISFLVGDFQQRKENAEGKK